MRPARAARHITQASANATTATTAILRADSPASGATPAIVTSGPTNQTKVTAAATPTVIASARIGDGAGVRFMVTRAIPWIRP